MYVFLFSVSEADYYLLRLAVQIFSQLLSPRDQFCHGGANFRHLKIEQWSRLARCSSPSATPIQQSNRWKVRTLGDLDIRSACFEQQFPKMSTVNLTSTSSTRKHIVHIG